jgi:uncharacterized protein (TIGR03382 family)
LPGLDSDVTLFYGSLILAAAAVVLFVWLMRERKER